MRIAAGVGTATIASAVLTSPTGIMMTGVPPRTIVKPWTVSGSPTALYGRPNVVSPRSHLGATVRAVHVLSQGRVVAAPGVLGVGNKIQYRLKQGTTIVEPWTVSSSPTALFGCPHVVSPRSRLGATVRAVRVLSQGRVVTAPRVLGVGNQIQYRLKQGILIYPTHSPS